MYNNNPMKPGLSAGHRTAHMLRINAPRIALLPAAFGIILGCVGTASYTVSSGWIWTDPQKPTQPIALTGGPPTRVGSREPDLRSSVDFYSPRQVIPLMTRLRHYDHLGTALFVTVGCLGVVELSVVCRQSRCSH